MQPPVPQPLDGRTVVVTRPAGQAGRLMQGIRAAGGCAVAFPVLEIRDPADRAPLEAIVDRLDDYDLAIFISPTAVDKAMTFILARRTLPAGLSVAAIGKGSARELARFGVADVLVPQGSFDSEGLLALPELARPAGRRIVVFRGEGGRELLADTLAARGARVEYAQCYLRARPDSDARVLMQLWAGSGIDAIVVTSSEGLRNLHDLVGPCGLPPLSRTPVFVPHERIAQTGRELGLCRLEVTAGGDEGLLAGLMRHFAALPR
jgi:uroporphyrinogen-III synthase